MKMIQLVAASAIALLSSVSAYAADMVAPSQPVYSWAGGYVGIQGGYGWTDAKFTEGPFAEKENFNGGLLGVHAGYNFQSGAFVYGLEGDVSYNWNKTDIFDGFMNARADWQGSLRLRAGYALDRVLIYGTGGVAIANGVVKYPGFPINVQSNKTFTGFTVGAGAEYAFAENWTARLEYRYTDFGKQNVGLIIGDIDAKLKQQSVLVGVSYKF